MKITSLTISNFRGYKDSTTIKFDNLTAIVGKNDIGKSTLLEALDVFFNDGKGAVKLDETDMNNTAVSEGNKETLIAVSFSNFPEKIVLDASYETSLSSEYLLNSNGELEVLKKYTSGGPGKVFIRALHPTGNNCCGLLLKKNSDLKSIIQSNSVQCENLAINSVMRKSIWKHFSNNLDLADVEIDITKEDANKIWDRLSLYLPAFSLFQADRKNSDNDNEVQDPLKAAVKQILMDPGIQQELASIAEKVNLQLKEVVQGTLEKLSEIDLNIASALCPQIPDVHSLKWTDVFKNVSITGDYDIPINKRGSGVRRLVLLSFFRAQVEKRNGSNQNTGVIYAIEEPETSQHSANQKLLIDALNRLAHGDNTQVIMTTHSAYMVKQLSFDNLRVIINNEQGNKEIRSVSPAQLQYPSLNEVNYVAFNEITEEYHNELWAYILENHWENEYKQGKTTRQYIREEKGILKTEYKILSEYIRHIYHHPENHNNTRYTLVELKESIESMRLFIQNKRDAISP